MKRLWIEKTSRQPDVFINELNDIIEYEKALFT